MMRRLPLAALLAAGCGTGTDGKPVAPPTTPEPAPEAPAKPSHIRLVERGPDFLVWEWDPVEGATGYEIDLSVHGTPPGERPPVLSIAEPTFRAEGLEQGVVMRFYVRAVRETAGGVATSEWSNYVTASPWPEPRVCTDERQRALERYTRPVLLDEWDGTPFRFYFDAGIPASERADAEHFFGVAERLSERIEEQLGYSILEVAGWIPEAERGFRIGREDVEDCVGVRPGGIVATVIPFEERYAAARPYCGVVFWTDNDIWADSDGTLPHEIFHLFGFGHSLETHPHEAWQGGVAMSVRLTNSRWGPRDLGVTFEDVDALRCILPEGG